MGDYRNELQSALSQVEALRGENASLRARLRAAGVDVAGPSYEGNPAPGRRRVRGAAAVALATSALVAGLGAVVVVARPARAPRPDAPYAAAPAAAPGTLPMPPTRVTLPARSRAAPEVHEVTDARVTEPWQGEAVARREKPWEQGSAREGLLVLTTIPEAECSVGGVLFNTPRPVWLGEGEYAVRCVAGHVRRAWRVRIAARRATFDLGHPVSDL